MTGEFRLVACDLDGTLLRRDGTLSDRTISAVNRVASEGLEFVLVSARPPRWIDGLAASLQCHPLAVCSNGALIYDATTKELVAEHPLAPDAAAEVLRRLRNELEGVTISVEMGLRYGKEPQYPNKWPLSEDSIIAEAEQLLAEPVAKLCVRHSDSREHWELLELCRQAIGDLAEITSSSPDGLIEVAAPGVSKAFALELLARQLSVEPDEVIAFGDMPNDLPMLAWAGHSVAPSNAHPDVLAVVDRVTDDCDADGVAVVLEELSQSGRLSQDLKSSPRGWLSARPTVPDR
jgi:Cof subfamily protein (haloacid dehalogenase superfamily)